MHVCIAIIINALRQIDNDLVVKLLDVVCAEQVVGAILVFLPGHDDIMRLLNALSRHSDYGNARRFTLLPLHSSISSAEQQRVFVRSAQEARKIIMSTNIAETSVTIDDVVCVIDCGRVKELVRVARALKDIFIAFPCIYWAEL